MWLASVSSKTSHNRAWIYDVRDPLGKVHFKRPGPLAQGKKLRDPFQRKKLFWSFGDMTSLLALGLGTDVIVGPISSVMVDTVVELSYVGNCFVVP